MSKKRLGAPYPRNWTKASRTLRRIIGHCEKCGATEYLSVHHRGIRFADGQPNHPANKRDLRRENLQVLCWPCHQAVEQKRRDRRTIMLDRYQTKKAAHQALGVGTGLVLSGSEAL